MGTLEASISSVTGKINFDSNDNGQAEAVLNETGLGIGTATPSHALEVAGNAIVQNRLGIGSLSLSSNLTIAGSMSFSVQTITSDTTLGDHTLVLADTSSSDLTLTLPSAVSYPGRIYTIKKISLSNNLRLTSNDQIDGNPWVLMDNTNSTLARIKVISNGSTWYIMDTEGTLDDVTQGLASRWKLDESSGLVAADSKGSNTGTLTNMSGSEWLSAVYNGGLNFDGTNDYITVPDSSTIGDDVQSNLTITAWFKSDVELVTGSPTTAGRFLEKGSDYFLIPFNNSGMCFVFFDNGNNIHEIPLGSYVGKDRWHMIAGTFDGTTQIARLYFDGKLISNVNIGNSLIRDSDLPLVIGSDDASNRFTGSLDDIRIYSSTLSASEIAQIYTRTKNPNHDLLLHCPLDETSGTSIADSSYINANITSNNSIVSATGKIGTAIDFNGSSDSLSALGSSTYTIGGKCELSISFWFNADTIDAGNIQDRMISFPDNGFSTGLILAVGQSGKIQEYIGSTIENWPTTIVPGSWYHLVMTYDEGEISRYVNGSLVGVASNRVIDNIVTSTSLKIGANSSAGGQYYDGKLDDLRIYRHVLSATEVLALYQLAP